MRRTPLPSSFSLVAHDVSLLFFPCLLTRGLDLVMTLSTNACSKLGLLHYIFLFLEIAMCIATDGRKTDVVCCGRSLDILPVYTHLVFSPRQGALPRIALSYPCAPPSTASHCALPLATTSHPPLPFLLPLPSVLYRPTQLYVCAQYNALARSRTSNNNVKLVYAVDG